MTTLNKSERKRGRPPKNMVMTKPTKNIIERKETEEQLVLFLPSFDNTISDKRTNNEFLSITESETKNKFKHLTDNFNKSDEHCNNLSDNNSNNSNNSDDTENIKIKNKGNINIEKLVEELHKKDALIMHLKSKLKDKSIYNENVVLLNKDNKKKLINLGLITINDNKLHLVDKTDIACWWCTYNFDTIPLGLPDHFKNNTFYVFGNFCSFSCMLAYNDNLDDYRKSVRTGLIKQLYKNVFNNDNMIIKASGPRELLNKFGGPMDISKYRDSNSICTKNFKISLPPMIPLLADYEELNIS